jgi:hypothetical protein
MTESTCYAAGKLQERTWRNSVDRHTGGRLVEEKHAWPVQERSCDFQSTAHAARERSHALVGLAGQADPQQRIINARAALTAWHTINHAMDLQILARGEPVIHGGILKDETEGTANRRRRRDHVVPGDLRRALGRTQQGAQDLDGRRLASAVGSQKSKDLTRGNPE